MAASPCPPPALVTVDFGVRSLGTELVQASTEPVFQPRASRILSDSNPCRHKLSRPSAELQPLPSTNGGQAPGQADALADGLQEQEALPSEEMRAPPKCARTPRQP